MIPAKRCLVRASLVRPYMRETSGTRKASGASEARATCDWSRNSAIRAGTTDQFSRINTGVGTAGAPLPVNGEGLVTFKAKLTSEENQEGLWVEQPNGSLRLVAKTGDPALGTTRPFVDLGLEFSMPTAISPCSGSYLTPQGDDSLRASGRARLTESHRWYCQATSCPAWTGITPFVLRVRDR